MNDDNPTVRSVYERWKAQNPSAQAIIAAECHETWKAEQLTLRDRFAMAALQGMNARDMFYAGLATPEQRARLAFIEADAMLAERSKANP